MIMQLKAQHDHAKHSSQKLMLRKIEWGVQNGYVKRNRVLPPTIFFLKTYECKKLVLV